MVGLVKLKQRQFPSKEVDELEQEMFKIRTEVHAEAIQHEGQNAQEAYRSRLHSLSLTEGEVPDGDQVIQTLLIRIALWLEIMREKWVFIDNHKLTSGLLIPYSTDKAISRSASKISTKSSSKSAINWNR